MSPGLLDQIEEQEAREKGAIRKAVVKPVEQPRPAAAEEQQPPYVPAQQPPTAPQQQTYYPPEHDGGIDLSFITKILKGKHAGVFMSFAAGVFTGLMGMVFLILVAMLMG